MEEARQYSPVSGPESSWWWPLLLAALVIWIVQDLWRAQGQGIIKMQQWEVKRAERPAAFWFAVMTEMLFLITALVFLGKWAMERL